MTGKEMRLLTEASATTEPQMGDLQFRDRKWKVVGPAWKPRSFSLQLRSPNSVIHTCPAPLLWEQHKLGEL